MPCLGESSGSSPAPAYSVQSPQVEKCYMEATLGSDPKMKPLRVCLQAGGCCSAACWAVLQGQHIKTQPRISVSVLGMRWFLSWVMCGVHSSVPFSPFKMPTFVFTKSLGATVHPVAVVWWCLRVASMNQQKVCDLNPTQTCWAQAAPMLGLFCCSTGGSEPINHCLTPAAAVVTELFRSRAEWDPPGWHLWLCGLHCQGI